MALRTLEERRGKGSYDSERLPNRELEPPPENEVYLHLKNVKDKVFTKYDWIFLNDRILFVKMTGIGIFVANNVLTKYTGIMGAKAAMGLIKHLKELRKKKSSTLSDQDLVHILSVEDNSELLYADMEQVRLKRKFLGGYRLLVLSKSLARKADIPWNKVSYKKLVHFFKARVGTKFIED